MWNGMMQGIYCGRDVGKAMVQQGNKALNEQRIHPTQKPVALYAWLLKEYAKDGWRIFDPMMGSQSSRIAAYKMGFDFVGCEIDREYFAKGCERFDAECLNRTKMPTGQVIEQLSLFGE
jgi:site-specific DNA-methyltransferase (adenine-specific)